MDSNGDQSGGPVSVDHRKLFVGGLSQETTEDNVREYFSAYGGIESINLKTDSNTGNSRGFAFIVFNSSDAIDAILNEEHTINNKQVDVQKAKTKQGKLFVGGITPEMTEDDIKAHFEQFGNIVQAEFPFDKVRNERKKFCFIIFDTEQAVKDIVKTRKQVINDTEVDVKKAVAKEDRFGGGGGGGGFNNFSSRGGSGRGGGGRGGRGGGGYQSSWNQGYQSGGGGGGYSSSYNKDYNSSSYGGGGGGGWDSSSGGYGGSGGGGYNQGGFSSNGGGGYSSGGGGGYGSGGFQSRPRGGGNRGRGARQQPY